MHKYQITLYEHYEIEAETEAEAKALAIEEFATKYNFINVLSAIKTDMRYRLPEIKVTAKLEAFDNL